MKRISIIALIAISFVAGTVTVDSASGFTYQKIIFEVMSSADKSMGNAEKSMNTVVSTIEFVGDDLGDDHLIGDLDELISITKQLHDSLECSQKDIRCIQLENDLLQAQLQAILLHQAAGIIATELDAGLLPNAQKLNTDIENLSEGVDDLKQLLKKISKDSTKVVLGSVGDILQ